MKVIKLLVIMILLFSVNQAKAQESKIKPFTKKKMKWMDKDKSGDVSFEEMKKFYQDKKNKDGTPMKYGRMFLGLDANNDSKISLEELNKKVDWALVRKKMKEMSEEEIAKYDITL